MSTFSATANSNTTIGYANYGSSSWNVGGSNGASQGAYQQTSSNYSRVGVMVFSNANIELAGKTIQQITFNITCSGAGSGSSNKQLTFRQANYQSLNTSVKGSAQIGIELGTLTGSFYSNTTTHILNASSNSTFFNNLARYLSAGNNTLVLYRNEVASSSTTYSTNYARITSITMTVNYSDSQPYVWYYTGNEWKKCAIYYYTGSTWKQCTPYFCDEGWIKV